MVAHERRSTNAQCAAMRGARCSATCDRKASRCCASERDSTLPSARQPFDAAHAVQRLALRVPAAGVGAAEAIEELLRLRQAQVVGADFDVEQHHVDVEEEVQVDVHDLQRDRRVAGPRHDAHRRDVAAAEHAHRRVAAGSLAGLAALAAVAVQEALHVGQEGDELVVVALVEAAAVAGVFVDLLAPRRCSPSRAAPARGRDARRRRARRHQAQRPQQGLAQVAHAWARRRGSKLRFASDVSVISIAPV